MTVSSVSVPVSIVTIVTNFIIPDIRLISGLISGVRLSKPDDLIPDVPSLSLYSTAMLPSYCIHSLMRDAVKTLLRRCCGGAKKKNPRVLTPDTCNPTLPLSFVFRSVSS